MTDQNMPTTYETQTTSQPMSIGFHKEYLKSLPGILKMVEIVLSLITFICAVSGHWWGCYGCQGWVDFVALTAFFSTLITFIFYLVGIYTRFGTLWVMIEFIYYCVFTGLFVIASIVAASQASKSSAGVGAATFFSFAATAVYAVDTFFQFRTWRSGQTEMGHTTTTTTSTGYNPEAGKATY